MIGLVKQNIEFTLKKDGFLHYLKPKQPFGSQVRKSALSAELPFAVRYTNVGYADGTALRCG